jgi:WD40 repeat protein
MYFSKKTKSYRNNKKSKRLKKQTKTEYKEPAGYVSKWFGGFYPDNNRIMFSSYYGLHSNVDIYNIISKQTMSLSIEGGNVQKSIMSPDGKTIVMSFFTELNKKNKRKTYHKIFDAETGREIRHLNPNHRFISFSSDSKNIATFHSGYVYIISISNGKNIVKIKIENIDKEDWYEEKIRMMIVLSPDFTRIGTINDDGNVSIIVISSGKETIIEQLHPTYFFCFSPDGASIATIIHTENHRETDNIIRIFEIDTGKEIKQIKLNYEILVFEGSVDTYNLRNICFSPDGKNIASYSTDGFARIFDVSNTYTKEIFKSAYIDSDRDTYYKVCFSPNSQLLVVYSQYSYDTYIFDLKTPRERSVLNKFPIELYFSFEPKSNDDEDYDISALSNEAKEFVKETALLNLDNLQHLSYPPDINIKNCKFIFNNSGLTVIASTNYNPSSRRMREWMRWDLYWFNDRGMRIYPNHKYNIELDGKPFYLGKISLTPFVLTLTAF